MSNFKWAAAGAALLATSALTTAASASEWSADITGGATLGLAYFSLDDSEGSACGVDCEPVGLLNDSEVDFQFNMTADNGITFQYRMELETDAGGAFDEYYATIKGSFGKVEIGVNDGASDQLNITPPGCSFSCPGDDGGFIFDYFDSFSNVDIDADGDDTGDAQKITYITPTFAGFTAGASWVPNVGDAEGSNNTDLSVGDSMAWELGARWRGDITEDFDLGVSVVYADSDDGPTGTEGFESNLAIAAEVGIMDMASVGGRYIWDDAIASSDDREVLSLGAEYGTGPWGFFINWAQNLEGPAGVDGDWGLSGVASYDLAPGVTLAGVLEYGSPDEDFDDEFVIGTMMGLSF